MIWASAGFQLIQFCEFLKGLNVCTVERLYMLVPRIFMETSFSTLLELQLSFSPCFDQLLLKLYLDHSWSSHFSYQSVIVFLVLIVLKSFVIWTFPGQLPVFLMPAPSEEDIGEVFSVIGQL
jgi:hypothetical protein